MNILHNLKVLKYAGVIIVIGVVCQFCFVAGVTRATSQFQAEKLSIIEEQDKELRVAIAEAKAQQKRESEKVIESLRLEQKITENIRHVEAEISQTDFNCPDLGPEFLRLFNAAIPD